MTTYNIEFYTNWNKMNSPPSLESSSGDYTLNPTNSYDEEHINDRLKVLNAAYIIYSFHPIPPSGNNLEFASKAERLSEDIMNYEDVWLNTIFDSKENLILIERTLAILDSYCAILRGKGEVEKAHRLLKISDMVMTCYHEAYNLYSDDESFTYSYKILCYKHNLLSLNVHAQLENRQKAVIAFRQAIRHEIKEKSGVETQNWALILPILFGPDYINLTIDRLNEISDDKLWFAVSQSVEDPLAKCENCGKKEKNKNEFMTCSRCRAVTYCSKECQKEHWKLHKKNCKRCT